MLFSQSIHKVKVMPKKYVKPKSFHTRCKSIPKFAWSSQQLSALTQYSKFLATSF